MPRNPEEAMPQAVSKAQENRKQPFAPPAAETRSYTISDLAREFDVSLRALRFYEDRGLLHPDRRGNARSYSAQERVRLQIILKGKQLSFTLTEIHDMFSANAGDSSAQLELGLRPDQVLAQIEHLERQRLDLDQAIGELRATHRKLAGDPASVAA